MGGAPPDFFWQEDVVPWVEIYPDLFEAPVYTHPQPASPRIFRSAASYSDLSNAGLLDGEGKARVIYVYRDLTDVYYSLFIFFPALFQVDSMSIHLEDFAWCAKILLADHYLWTLVYFWKRRHDPDVLVLFYDELYGDGNECVVQRIGHLLGLHNISADLVDKVLAQTTHHTMSSDEHWDRFSGMSVAIILAERLNLIYRYELEPYLGKVSKIGGKQGIGWRMLSEQTVQMLQQRWHAIVTRELGFKNLEEMQRFRAAELAILRSSSMSHGQNNR